MVKSAVVTTAQTMASVGKATERIRTSGTCPVPRRTDTTLADRLGVTNIMSKMLLTEITIITIIIHSFGTILS